MDIIKFVTQIAGKKAETVYTASFVSTGWDSTLKSDTPAGNNNTTIYLSTGYYAPAKYRFIFLFNIASIPLTATIKSATLTLTCVDAAVSNSIVSFYPVLVSWDAPTVTWNSRATGTAWQTAGCDGALDRSSTAIGSVSRLTTDADGTKKIIPLTVGTPQQWASYLNSSWGLLAKSDVEATNSSASFYSSNSATASNRPVLTITYTNNVNVSPINKAINWIKYAVAELDE